MNHDNVFSQYICIYMLVIYTRDVQSGKQKQEGWPTDSVLNYWQNSGMV